MTDKTVIVTGASQGIGAGLANHFLERGYNVVATSRRVSQSAKISRRVMSAGFFCMARAKAPSSFMGHLPGSLGNSKG